MERAAPFTVLRPYYPLPGGAVRSKLSRRNISRDFMTHGAAHESHLDS